MPEEIASKLRTTLKGSTLIFFGILTNTALMLLVRVIVVRSTTMEELGLYSIVIAAAGISSVIASAGLPQGVARYVSIFVVEGRNSDAKAVAGMSIKVGIKFGTIVSVALFLLSGPISEHVFFKPELVIPLRVVSFSVLFSVMSSIGVGAMRGHGILRPQVYFQQIGNPLLFAIFIVVFFSLKLNFISILYAYLFSMMLTFSGIFVYGWRKMGLSPFIPGGGEFRRDLLGYSLPLLSAHVMQLIMIWTDTFMLGRYAGAEHVGIYNVSVTSARFLTYITEAVAFVFMPLAAGMYAKRHLIELKKTYVVLSKWILSANIPVFFVLFFFAEMVLTFLYGERYIISARPLQVLSLGLMVSILFVGAASSILYAYGLTRVVMNISVFSAILNVFLNYILIKRLGLDVIGASTATAASCIALNALVLIFLYKHVGVHPFRAAYLRPSAGAALSGIAIYAVAKSLPLYLWMLPLYLILFIGSYVFIVLLSGSLESEDLDMIEALSEKTGIEMKALKGIIRRFIRE